jgi:ribosomal protein S27AE
MNANCPNCQQQTTFVSVENKKYKCEKCNTVRSYAVEREHAKLGA